MKVLFCSPYKEDDSIVKGGINTWGKNIISYYRESQPQEIELIPVSFDRSTLISETVSVYKRIVLGIKELWHPIKDCCKIMAKESPEVVHICTSAGLGLIKDIILTVCARKYNLGIAVHLHFGRVPQMIKERSLEWRILKRVLNSADKVVVMNRQTERSLGAEGFSNICYLPNPLGKDVPDIVESCGVYTRKPRTILFVGHVYKTKGVYELIKGCKSIPNIEIRIAGKYSNEIRNDLEIIAGTDVKIIFLGELVQIEVIKEFLSADLFVFPSYTEGFPNVILEAMIARCPIVASDVGAIPEMLDINGNPCGICFKPQSSLEVNRAVESIINNEKLKNEYAAKAYKRVLDSYSMPKVWEQISAIWEIISRNK